MLRIYPLEYEGWYYYHILEETEDDYINLHFAVNKETRKHIILSYDPHLVMTRKVFNRLVVEECL
jgi:hypothetical protein